MNQNGTKKMRLIIISNRLPFTFEKVGSETKIHLASGGLVTALLPVLRDRGGIWIGSTTEACVEEEAYKKAGKECGFDFVPVALSKEEVDLYYHGFSNEILWPLFHDLVAECNFDPRYWKGYQAVNRKFAEAAAQLADENDFIWVHDYQLLLVAHELRKMGFEEAKLGFFLHTPFPSLDMFVKLPWRHQLIRALLDYALVGFQTVRDRRNFIHSVKTLADDVSVQNKKGMHICKVAGREVAVGTFPISIDFRHFDRIARSEDVATCAWLLHEKWANQILIFSLDRLDYSKGIPYRLEAIRCFLQKHPEFHKQVSFVQVVVPSRVDIPSYQALKREIDRIVGEINSQFTEDNWVPITYMFRSISQEELASLYRTCEVCLVTSLKDGMNLVSKEYIASQIDLRGVLILSEFAGAAARLREGALIVNPFAVEEIADAIYKALTMTDKEKKDRMRRLRRQVKHYNIFWWVALYLEAAVARQLNDFPLQEEIDTFTITNHNESGSE